MFWVSEVKSVGNSKAAPTQRVLAETLSYLEVKKWSNWTNIQLGG